MKRIELNTRNVDETAAIATEFLQQGGVVVMPMDTSYGIAVDAANPAAVAQVFTLKDRAPGQPLSVIVASLEAAQQYGALDETAKQLWLRFMPGPLTLVVPIYQLQPRLAAYAQAEGVGLRQPNHPLTQAVAERFTKPFTATSANISTHPPAFELDEFLAQLPEDGLKPHLVIDGGTLPVGPSSTVVDVSVRPPRIIREGAVAAADITATLS